MIRKAHEKDCQAITDIYNYYIANSTATFEIEAIDAVIIRQRIDSTVADKMLWLVAENEVGDVVGYAYTSKWKERIAYKNSVEISVYLLPDLTSKGIGTALYSRLFEALINIDAHAVMAGISLPNAASIALHEKFGMKKVAHFSEVGKKFNQWIDVGYWQVLLND